MIPASDPSHSALRAPFAVVSSKPIRLRAATYDGSAGRMMANVNRTPGYWVPVPLVDTPGMFGLRSLTTAQPIVSAPVPPAFAPGLIVADEPSAATDLTTVPSLTNEPCRFRPTSLATN